MKIKFILIILFNLILISHKFLLSQQPNTTIVTFFIRPSLESDIVAGEKMASKLKVPGKSTQSFAKKMLKELYNTGIFVSYLGNSAVSDKNGQVVLKMQKKTNIINMVITQSIKPVFMKSNTIHHFIISDKTDAKWYRFQKTEDNKTKKYFWVVTEKNITSENLPADILIVSTKPKHIYVPVGKFPSNDDPNLVLPDIYAKNGISTSLNAIKFFKVKKYFSPIKPEYKFGTQSYQELVV